MEPPPAPQPGRTEGCRAGVGGAASNAAGRWDNIEPNQINSVERWRELRSNKITAAFSGNGGMESAGG